jgi:hypothetical protein
MVQDACGTAPVNWVLKQCESWLAVRWSLYKTPTSLMRLNPDSPADLEKVISKVLEKGRKLHGGERPFPHPAAWRAAL